MIKNKLMRILFITCGLCISAKGFAQVDSIQFFHTQNDKKLFVSTNLLPYINLFTHQRANIAFDYLFTKRHNAEIGFEYYYEPFHLDQPTSGYGFNIEYKYFLNDKIGYIGIGYALAIIDYQLIDHLMYSNDTSRINYSETFEVNKIFNDFYFKVGGRFQFNNSPFFMEIFGKLGMKYVDCKHIDRKYPEDELMDPIFLQKNKAGQYIKSILQLGLVIGLDLNLKKPH